MLKQDQHVADLFPEEPLTAGHDFSPYSWCRLRQWLSGLLQFQVCVDKLSAMSLTTSERLSLLVRGLEDNLLLTRACGLEIGPSDLVEFFAAVATETEESLPPGPLNLIKSESLRILRRRPARTTFFASRRRCFRVTRLLFCERHSLYSSSN